MDGPKWKTKVSFLAMFAYLLSRCGRLWILLPVWHGSKQFHCNCAGLFLLKILVFFKQKNTQDRKLFLYIFFIACIFFSSRLAVECV